MKFLCTHSLVSSREAIPALKAGSQVDHSVLIDVVPTFALTT